MPLKQRNQTETLLYKNISLILFSKRAPSLLLVWEIDGGTYTQRGDFLFHIFFREPRGSNACTSFSSRIVTDASDRLPIPGSTLDSLPLCLNLTAWLSRGLLPVTHLLDQSVLTRCHPPTCLLITTWQLIKAHEVTRNELKIHVICYITFSTKKNYTTVCYSYDATELYT